jgi:hypothetical protein
LGLFQPGQAGRIFTVHFLNAGRNSRVGVSIDPWRKQAFTKPLDAAALILASDSSACMIGWNDVNHVIR